MKGEPMSQKFTFNGVEKNFDIGSIADNKRFEQAIRNMQEEEPKLPKTGYASDIMQAQVNMIKKFFDTVFGEGAGNELCGEEDNLNNCYEAYENFIIFVGNQKNTMLNKRRFGADRISGKKRK